MGDVLKENEERYYVRKGKNFYVTSIINNVKITINSNTFRVITVDMV